MGVTIKKSILLSLFITCLFSTAWAGKSVVLEGPERPTALVISGNELFVIDGFTVHVYSLDTLEFKFKFGKRGEGPGELRSPAAQLFPLKKHVFLTTPFAAHWFTREGKPVKKKNFTGIRQALPVNRQFVICREQVDRAKKKVTRTAVLVTPEFEPLKELYTVDFDVNVGGFGKARMILHYFGIRFHGDRIFIADSRKGLFIKVFDTSGKHVYTIDKKVEPVRCTAAFQAGYMEELKSTNLRNYEHLKQMGYMFYNNFPAIRSFQVSDKKIYIVTYREKEGRRELLVLDMAGKILEQKFIHLPSFTVRRSSIVDDVYFTIHKGTLYQLIDNVDESQWELHIDKL